MKKWVALGIGILLIAGIGFYYWRQNQAQSYSDKARAALKVNDFQTARVYAERALSFRPNNTSDLICYSESVFKDTTIEADQRVRLALDALEKISDHSSDGYTARLHEASILFFDQLQVAKAEDSLNRAITIKPNSMEPVRSLIKIYCCTGRATFVEPLVRKMLESATSKEEKMEVLAIWFLSQFSVQSINSATDQMLRVNTLFEYDIPLSQKRLLAFRDADQDAMLPRVALAHWFYLRSDGKQAKTLLDQLDPAKIDLSDPLYLMTAVNVYFECGEIELAKDLHGFWKDKKYFEYWRQKGVIEQDYQNDPASALESLENALAIWPGPIDPSIYFRLSTCHRLAGNPEKSEKYRVDGEEMRNVTDVDRIKELQGILLSGNLSRKDCVVMEAFYSSFERSFEAEQWRELAKLFD